MAYTYTITNLIPEIQNKSYLELGIADNMNFTGTKAKTKFSVDINGSGMFRGTTDEYFESLDPNVKFDVIYIDANHDYHFVLRDLNNSLKHCNEWILLHDMVPPSKGHTAQTACSDSYKILYYIIKERPDIIWYTLKPWQYMGLTFIKVPIEPLNVPDHYFHITYEQLCEAIKEVKLYSPQEMLKIFSSLYVAQKLMIS